MWCNRHLQVLTYFTRSYTVAKINPIQLQKALKGVKYPAKKKDLEQAAKDNGASDEIRSALKELKQDEFARPSDVSKAVREEVAQ
jgi:hypothetical protein